MASRHRFLSCEGTTLKYPGFLMTGGESCTTEDVRGEEITFRNLVPVAGSSGTGLQPLCKPGAAQGYQG